MSKIPFAELDGREEKTRLLRNAAYSFLGSKEQYDKATYMAQSLACRAAMLEWFIERQNLSAAEYTQANNAYLGLCKLLASVQVEAEVNG